MQSLKSWHLFQLASPQTISLMRPRKLHVQATSKTLIKIAEAITEAETKIWAKANIRRIAVTQRAKAGDITGGAESR